MSDYVKLHVGLDDIDSPEGGCTTHLAAKLVSSLESKFSIYFFDYPNLIRLNPNIPWKTRGNGAVALRFFVEESRVNDVIEYVVSEAINYVGGFKHPQAQPAVAFLVGEVGNRLRWLSRKAVEDIVLPEIAKKVAEKSGVKLFTLGRGNRGVVGASAAIGEPLDKGDYTYELLAYRVSENYGKLRMVDERSIFEMDKVMGSETFLNVDYEVSKILITPHGPDPVLLGIRGESAEAVLKAYSMVRVLEPIERWVIFRTNQATDAHIRYVSSISEIRVYQSVSIEGRVSRAPRTIPGGHVIFTLSDGIGEVDCAAYQPTGRFRNIVKQLKVGDKVRVYGGVRPASSKHGLTINLEKIDVIEVVEEIIYRNPKCPKCGATMKSAGKGKGFKCPKCGYKGRNLAKVPIKISRTLKPGTYTPPPRAYRHLMKPPQRIGKEKAKPPTKIIPKWHHP
mgnify:CR=1 FL=1